MVELATITIGTTYTGNEPWVAEIEKFDRIYVETDYGSVGVAYTVGTQIYSSASFKKLLDEGKTMTTTTGEVYLLMQALGGSSLRHVKLSNSVFKGSNVSSLKIYGIK